MVRRMFFLAVSVAAGLVAQEEVAPTIAQLTKDGDALYLKGNYEAARVAFTSAWELAQQTPNDNPARYDILKRLTSVRAAAGEFADADNWLQQAITWRENTLGWKDHKIADDLLISVGLCRGMKDFDRALAILRRVQSLHVEAYTFDSAMVADDFSRMGGVFAEKNEIDSAIHSIDAALVIRTKLAGPVSHRLIGLWESSVGKDHAMVAVALDKLAVFYEAQKKYPEVRDALERSTAIRARFLAFGISQQATQAFTEGQMEQVRAFYRRGMAVLDPPNPINEDLRGQFEGMLKALDAPPPKSGTVPKKAPTPPKKKDKL